MIKYLKFALAALVVFGLSACMADVEGEEEKAGNTGSTGGASQQGCDDGESKSCACKDGSKGERLCEDGKFGACECDEPGTGGNSGTGGSTATGGSKPEGCTAGDEKGDCTTSDGKDGTLTCASDGSKWVCEAKPEPQGTGGTGGSTPCTGGNSGTGGSTATGGKAPVDDTPPPASGTQTYRMRYTTPDDAQPVTVSLAGITGDAALNLWPNADKDWPEGICNSDSSIPEQRMKEEQLSDGRWMYSCTFELPVPFGDDFNGGITILYDKGKDLPTQVQSIWSCNESSDAPVLDLSRIDRCYGWGTFEIAKGDGDFKGSVFQIVETLDIGCSDVFTL